MNEVIQEYGSFIVEVLCGIAVVTIIGLVMNGMSDLAMHVTRILVGG